MPWRTPTGHPFTECTMSPPGTQGVKDKGINRLSHDGASGACGNLAQLTGGRRRVPSFGDRPSSSSYSSFTELPPRARHATRRGHRGWPSTARSSGLPFERSAPIASVPTAARSRVGDARLVDPPRLLLSSFQATSRTTLHRGVARFISHALGRGQRGGMRGPEPPQLARHLLPMSSVKRRPNHPRTRGWSGGGSDAPD